MSQLAGLILLIQEAKGRIRYLQTILWGILELYPKVVRDRSDLLIHKSKGKWYIV